MHPLACRRGIATPVAPIICRTLTREYRLLTSSEKARESLMFMEIAPDLPGRELEPFDIEIASMHGFLKADLPDGGRPAGTAVEMLTLLHRLVLWDYARTYGDWPMVHGATIVVGGKRLLLIGDKGAGKSTLSLHMAARGHLVEGDEHAAIGAESVVARPRTLRLKPGSFDIVSGLPEGLRQAPRLAAWDGSFVYAVDPSRLGHPWIIAEGPLHAVILIDPNHGGRSVAKPISADAGFAGLMANTYFTGKTILQLTARLRTLAARTPAYNLRLGDLDGAEWQLKMIAEA